MKHYKLSTAEWTLIVPPNKAEDADIRPLQGSCLTSLNFPCDKGAMTLAMPPVPLDNWEWAGREVMAGIAVYAKAIDGPASVAVGQVVRQ